MKWSKSVFLKRFFLTIFEVFLTFLPYTSIASVQNYDKKRLSNCRKNLDKLRGKFLSKTAHVKYILYIIIVSILDLSTLL